MVCFQKGEREKEEEWRARILVCACFQHTNRTNFSKIPHLNKEILILRLEILSTHRICEDPP